MRSFAAKPLVVATALACFLGFGGSGCGSGGDSSDESRPSGTPTPTPVPSAAPTASALVRAFAAGSDDQGGVILRSDDGGGTWAVVERNAPGFLGLAFVDRLTGWAVGPREIRHTTDGGESWTVQRESDEPFFETFFDAAFLSPSRGVVVGSSPPLMAGQTGSAFGPPLILLTINAGVEWSPAVIDIDLSQNPGGAQSIALREGCFTGGGIGLTVGTGASGAVLLVSTDVGATWVDIFDRLPQVSPGSIACVADSDLWLTQAGPRVHRSTNGGTSWVDLSANLPPDLGELGSIAFIDAMTGWAAGVLADDPLRPVVLHTSDGGASWMVQNIPDGPGGLNAVAFASRLDGVVVGATTSPVGPLGFASADGGETWRASDFPFGMGLVRDVRAIR